jgi:hypothetical protein
VRSLSVPSRNVKSCRLESLRQAVHTTALSFFSLRACTPEQHKSISPIEIGYNPCSAGDRPVLSALPHQLHHRPTLLFVEVFVSQ